MISSNDFRNGIAIEYEGGLFTIVDFQHVKPGKGSAFVRTKLKNIRTGYVVEKTFRAGEKVKQAYLDKRQMQFLYKQDTDFVFMDNKTFDQITLSAEQIGEDKQWLKEGTNIYVLFYQNEAIGVEIPNFVELKVIHTEPGFKGDTASAGNKPATLETGTIVQVPLFINTGDILQVDTRTSSYLKRM